MGILDHRFKGYSQLRGDGIEIGAFHQPAPLPARCKVEYVDALPKAEAVELFPEVDASRIVDTEHICDLDRQGLEIFGDAQFDFVIMNHVIEHVANPIRVIGEVFRVAKDGGYCVISAPDKRFTFDRSRTNTRFEHLLEEYRAGVESVTDDHYLDFVLGLEPGLDLNARRLVEAKIERARKRREHAHVWDSDSFRHFLSKALDSLGVTAVCLFESAGETNQFEHFSVWRKGSASAKRTLPSLSSARKWLSRLLTLSPENG